MFGSFGGGVRQGEYWHIGVVVCLEVLFRLVLDLQEEVSKGMNCQPQL